MPTASSSRQTWPVWYKVYQAQYKIFRNLFNNCLNDTSLSPRGRASLEFLKQAESGDQLEWSYQAVTAFSFNAFHSPSTVIVKECEDRSGEWKLQMFVRDTHPNLASIKESVSGVLHDAKLSPKSPEVTIRRVLFGKEQAWVWLLLYPKIMSAYHRLSILPAENKRDSRARRIRGLLSTGAALILNLDPNNMYSHRYWLNRWLPYGIKSLDELFSQPPRGAGQSSGPFTQDSAKGSGSSAEVSGQPLSASRTGGHNRSGPRPRSRSAGCCPS